MKFAIGVLTYKLCSVIIEYMDIPLLYSQLIRIENLNIWQGLSHVGCSKEAYADALKVFCMDLERKIDILAQFQKDENWKGYTAEIHAVKGGLAGIGALELAEQAQKLEDSSIQGTCGLCGDFSANTLGKIKELVISLKSTVLFDSDIKSRKTLPREEVSFDYLKEQLNELYAACSTGNSDKTNALAKELKTKICPAESTELINDSMLDTICNDLENLDYHLVLELLARQPYIRKDSLNK